MAKNEAKIKFTAETSGFNDAIKKSNDEMAKLRAEMKLNDTQMKAAGASVESLENKHKILTSQLAASESKTAALSQKVEKAAQIFGENSTEVIKLKTQLANALTAEEKIRQAINACNAELNEQRSAAKETESATSRLTNTIRDQQTELNRLKGEYSEAVLKYGATSKEAKELEGKISNLSSELKQNKDTLEDAAKKADTLDKSMEELSESAKDAGEGFTIMKGSLATFAGNMMTSAIGLFKDAATSIMGLAESTREYRTEMGKLETAFETAGHTTETATDTYKELYSVLGDEGQSVEAANMLAKLCDNEKDLTNWTNIATGVYGTFGASLPIESLAEAANETSKTGQITGALADALNWAGVSEDSFQEKLDGCSNEQERQALITETLNGLYSDAATKYRETNKSVMEANRANSDYTDTLAIMGEKIEPVTTAVKNGFNGLLQKILELVEDVDMAAFTDAVADAFAVLTDTVLPAVMKGLGWIIDNKDIIIAGLAGIAAGFVAFKVASLIQTVTSALQGMTIAQYALNLAMNLNPIGIIIALIAGLVAAFVVLWNKSEGFRNFFKGLWEGIKNIVGTVVGAIKNFFSGLWDGIKKIFGGVVDFFSGIFGGAKDAISGLWSGVKGFFGGIWNGIKGVFSKTGNWFKEKFSDAKEKVQTTWSNVKGFFGKCWDGIKGVFSKTGNWFKEKFTDAKEKVQTTWSNVKGFFGKCWDGIKGAFSGVGNWFKEKFTDAKDKAQNAWSNAKQIFSGIKDKVTSAFSNVGSWFKNTFSKAKENASNAWSDAKSKFTTIKNGITNVFSNVGSWFKSKFSSAKDGAVNAWSNAKSKFTTIKNGITNVFSNVGSWFKSKFSSAKDGAVNAWSNAKSKFSSIKNGITNAFSNVKSVISKPFESAKNAVSKVADKIKGFFSNMKLKLPKIKLPHFKITGKLSLSPPSIPKLSIDWYKEGGILAKPTIFGMNGTSLMAGGEAGPEAILPIDKLEGYVAGAIEKTMNVVNMQYLAKAIEDLAKRPIEMSINGKRFMTATASDGDRVNGLRTSFKDRGLVVD